jgi:hypothetical protein
MSYDPLYPADGILIRAVEMRTQFQGLKALIDAVPAGPPGPAGPEGPAFSSVQIGSVTTGAPGTPAAASVNTFGNNVELSFTIPAGETGSGVSFDDMTNAIAFAISGTARNPNTVAPLSLGTTDPQITAIVDKLNELIAALTR